MRKAIATCSALFVCSLVVGIAVSSARAEDEETAVVVGPETIVAIQYRLMLEDGTLVETTDKEGPVSFRYGGGEILPALEAAVTGLGVGESKEVKVPPKDAYGELDPEGFKLIPLDSVPEDLRTPGQMLRATAPDGRPMVAKIEEVRDDVIVVDLNHPLAGKTLVFSVEVVSVEVVSVE